MEQQIKRWKNKYNEINNTYKNTDLSLHESCLENNITTSTYYNICDKLNTNSISKLKPKKNIQYGGSDNNYYLNKYNNVNEIYVNNLLTLNESCKKNNMTIITYYNICKRLNKPSIAKTSSKSHNKKYLNNNIKQTGGTYILKKDTEDYDDIDISKYSKELDNIVRTVKENRNI